MGHRTGVWTIVSCAAALYLAAPAAAATTVGATEPAMNCGGPATRVQAVDPGGEYRMPFAGVITAWSTRAGASGGQLRLKIARPTAGGHTIVAEGPLETLVANQLNTFSNVRIPVQAGDIVGHFQPGVATACGSPAPGHSFDFVFADAGPGTFIGPAALNGIQINTSVQLEPDCDGDGFGDETQDSDLTTCDAAPPDTAISRGPRDKTKKKSATFEFLATDARAVGGFQCSLDDGAFAACTSPHTVKVRKGRHTFAVRAFDTNGNVDGTPATDDWKVKRRKKRK
jgi:hypothetical protein